VKSGAAPVLDSHPVDPELQPAGTAVLELVLSSRAFERTPTLRKLLSYLWEHRDEEISEYAIATEALRRRPDFEPRLDATVRVLVSRLRQRLKEFYEENGSELSMQIVIPPGTYQIQVVQIEPQSGADLPESLRDDEELVKIEKRVLSRSIMLIQFAVIVALALSTGWLIWQLNYERSQRVQADAARIPAFWKQLLGNGKYTRIIVPTPTFFTWKGGLVARDVQVNDYTALRHSVYLDYLSRHFGKPSLAQQYVASSDALAALELSRYLEGKSMRVDVSTAAQTSLEALDRENLILAGNSHTLDAFSLILDRLHFRLDATTGGVVDLRPVLGQAADYRTVKESSSRIIAPGIIASIPGATAGTRVLILLSGSFTSAQVAYLISEAGLRELERAQSAHGNCQYFEAVVLMEINGSTELKSKLVTFRPYRP
jgi:hypothetical protein